LTVTTAAEQRPLVESNNGIERAEEVRVVKAIDEHELAVAMFGAVRLVPPYSAITAETVLDEVLEHCRSHARATLRSLEAGTVPSDAELAFVRANAARRAQQRVPLTAILHAYRVGYAVVWERVRAEVQRHPVSIDAALALADHCVGYTNAISVAATDGYVAEQQRLSLDHDRTRGWLLDLLLRGERPRGDAEVLLSALRLDARGNAYVLVVGTCADDEPTEATDLESRLAAAIAALLPAFGDAPTLSGVLNDRAVALVVRPEAADVEAWIDAMHAAVTAMPHHDLLAVGLSTGWTDLVDVPRAYKEAVRAVGLARRDHRFVALSRTSLFDDLIGLADATTLRLVPTWASTFLEEDRRANGELSSTLLAYIASELSVGRAAADLAVHPNTIRYRLHRIESITGGTLRSYAHLFDILASLRLSARRRP
jgi:hypothetical protein